MKRDILTQERFIRPPALSIERTGGTPGRSGAILRYIPLEELRECLAAGMVEIWDLAEYFGVTEAFMRKCVEYYRDTLGMSF